MKCTDLFDIDIVDKIAEMSPEECKAMIMGFVFGIGAAEMFNELDEKEKDKQLPNRRYTRKYSPNNRYGRIRLLFQTRKDAQEVLDDIHESAEESPEGYVTVLDLYSHNKVDIMPIYPEMDEWGWREDDLESVFIREVKDSENTNFELGMPPAKRLV